MDKELINNKIDDLEAELQKLKQLANEPEQRTPEAGDVWAWAVDGGKPIWLVAENNQWVTIEGFSGRNNITDMTGQSAAESSYLGKFDEVYVKISDVRDALSHEDYDGESILKSRPLNDNPYGLATSREALRKLNIIQD